ncbi:hypothetical protein [Streptomyces sp. NBC_01264]|uniref:hypothetical protein n=1 Tax=Streptomyces sp. NBC_01264 TaxID=2903804 RepID=UPI00224FA9BF|nr:hypothetical protein [Streptomyces sp. NBC_01264]MCX4779025.1 hypothetical protein [Streptomyces sp. NBC_01264]
MDIFVVAHSPSREYDQTFVPQGMPVTPFADFDLKMDQAASLMSMTLLTAVGGVSAKVAQEDELENRKLTALSAAEFDRVKRAVDERGARAFTPGQDGLQNPIMLCDAPPGSGLCSAATGVHKCYGLLRQLHDYYRNGTGKVYLVYCRGTSKASGVDSKLAAQVSGGDDHIFQAFTDQAQHLFTLARDRDKTAFFAEFDPRSQRTKDLLRSWKPDIAGMAITARKAEQVFVAANGDLQNPYDLSEKGEEAGAALLRHYLANEPFRTLVTQVADEERPLGSFKSSAADVVMKSWGWHKVEREERIALLGYEPRFKTWYREGEQEKKAQLKEIKKAELRRQDGGSSSSSFDGSDYDSSYESAPPSPRAQRPAYHARMDGTERWQVIVQHFQQNWLAPDLMDPVDTHNRDLLALGGGLLDFAYFQGRLLLGFTFVGGKPLKGDQVHNPGYIVMDTSEFMGYYQDCCYFGKLSKAGDGVFTIVEPHGSDPGIEAIASAFKRLDVDIT